MGQRLKTDWILFVTVVVMVFFGLLILYSASSIMSPMDSRLSSSWHFVLRQLEWAAVGIVVMMALKCTPYRRFQSPAVAFTAIGIAIVLLIAVYVLDTRSHRWLRVGESFGVQPSALA